MCSNHLHLTKGYYVGGLTGFREVWTTAAVLKTSYMRKVHPVAWRWWLVTARLMWHPPICECSNSHDHIGHSYSCVPKQLSVTQHLGS